MTPALAATLGAPSVPATPDYDGHCQAPRWSPDGSKLAFEVNDHRKKTIELLVVRPGEGAAPRRISPPSAGVAAPGFADASGESVVHELSWSPVQGRFVYSATGAAHDYDLYLDSGGILAAAPGADGSPAWSPGGLDIVFSSARTGQGDLYVLDLGHPGTPPLRLTGDPSASELYPAWSPDGRMVVYVGHSPTGDHLFLVDDIAFPAPRAITAWPGSQTRPRFSPDGKLIAFYSNHEDPRRFDLYVMRLEGTPTRVATGVLPNDGGPRFTPDGRHLVFVRRDDAKFNPIVIAPLSDPTATIELHTGTVGNGDLDLVRRADGSTWLAVAAQGGTGDMERDFRRIWIAKLPGLP
jgi:Tol biopolymer transport system component